MSSVLDKIVANKRRELVLRKSIIPIKQLKSALPSSNKSLFKALSSPHSNFIFECKKASPSKGLIRADFNLKSIIDSYQKYASAISVLTDHKFFKGSFAYLKYVSQRVAQPVLAKDFFIDPYQVFEARYFGADAILLMLSVLDDQQYQVLADTAATLKLDVLTEVHDQKEMQRALALDAKIIGINNRNLKDLSIDLDTSIQLISGLTSEQKLGRVFISESGIENNQQIRKIAPYVDGFLIGSSIMAEKNLEQQCKQLIYGRNKICGITDVNAARDAAKAGAVYAGFIFHAASKRCISFEQALTIRNAIELLYVGVFVDQDLQQLISVALKLKLDVVQLHGDESIEYIESLRTAMPKLIIWKALLVKDGLSKRQMEYINNPSIDKILLDTHVTGAIGGTGESFDWSFLKDHDTNRFMLAGGLNKNNVQTAAKLACYGLDFNSGVEDQPGIKSPIKIKEIFDRLRA